MSKLTSKKLQLADSDNIIIKAHKHGRMVIHQGNNIVEFSKWNTVSIIKTLSKVYVEQYG